MPRKRKRSCWGKLYMFLQKPYKHPTDKHPTVTCWRPVGNQRTPCPDLESCLDEIVRKKLSGDWWCFGREEHYNKMHYRFSGLSLADNTCIDRWPFRHECGYLVRHKRVKPPRHIEVEE